MAPTIAASRAWPQGRSSGQHAPGEVEVEVRQAFEVRDRYVLVDLVDARVDRPELHALRAERCDETRIRRAAAGALLRWITRDRRQGRARGFAQGAFGGVEGFAAAMPV